ncbi:hypothetical protein Goari_019379 [Gossypium aridum]|uniref:Aminotransferase-like plant mobile domain-containing protein n=1 Tax=Gossypium aridum TaxID=34290 RepID=A0A7J8WSY4_GOSAI|nr:hypothetical protein [Gossypium aridum]
MERWRPEMHTFHLPCDKCTITLEDMELQLGLPLDGPIVTRRNFGGLDVNSSKVQSEQHARAYIFMIIGGLLMPHKS